MASTKDIIDGQRFNRQRLITAFSSGMPDGRELTPIRPWKSVIASLVLTVVIIVGAWISRLFAPTLPSGWDNGNLIINSTNGSRYVSIEGKLYPIRNSSSAHLLYPELSTITASDDALAKAELGPVVGIAGAPDKVPSPQKLTNASLTSCLVGNSTLWTAVNKPQRSRPATNSALLVSIADTPEGKGSNYLIAEGYRFTFEDMGTDGTNRSDRADSVLNAFGIRGIPPLPIPSQWANLFPTGEPLVPLTLKEAGVTEGEAPTVTIRGVGEVKVGTVVTVTRADGVKEKYWVVMADDNQAQLQYMSETAYTMYKLSPDGKASSTMEISPDELYRSSLSDKKLRPTWPSNITILLNSPDNSHIPCAYLSKEKDTQLHVGVDIPSNLETTTIEVASQTGALVKQADINTSIYSLIDEDGVAYTLSDWPNTGTALGYQNVVPLSSSRAAAWMNLFSVPGMEAVELSPTAAWATVPANARSQTSKKASDG